MKAYFGAMIAVAVLALTPSLAKAEGSTAVLDRENGAAGVVFGRTLPGAGWSAVGDPDRGSQLYVRQRPVVYQGVALQEMGALTYQGKAFAALFIVADDDVKQVVDSLISRYGLPDQATSTNLVWKGEKLAVIAERTEDGARVVVVELATFEKLTTTSAKPRREVIEI